MGIGKTFSAVFLCSAVVFVFLFGACGKKQTAETTANIQVKTGASNVEVTTVRAISRQVPGFIQATGTLVADEQSDVAPQTSGQVIATLVDVGAFVNQGDVIARLNDRDAQLRLQQARAGEQQAQAAVRQAEARIGLTSGGQFSAQNVPEVRAAQQNFEAAQAQIRNIEAQINNAETQARLAADTARRYGNLLATGDTPRVVYNQYQTQAESAREQVNAIRAQANAVRAQAGASRQQYEAAINNATQNNQGVAAAQSAVETARAATAIAQKAVNDTTVRAPFAGYISDRPTANGEYVTPSSRIATLVRTNPIKVNIQLPESDAARAKIGMSVSISVSAYPERQFAGQVTALNPTLDAVSRAVTVEAQIENQGNVLRPNMFATARILQPGGSQSIFVPRSAVLPDPTTNTATVYVIENGVARARAVQTGQEENDTIQIITGVSEGETVAASNVEQLLDGVTVIAR